jgi:hypothetical protein
MKVSREEAIWEDVDVNGNIKKPNTNLLVFWWLKFPVGNGRSQLETWIGINVFLREDIFSGLGAEERDGCVAEFRGTCLSKTAFIFFYSFISFLLVSFSIPFVLRLCILSILQRVQLQPYCIIQSVTDNRLPIAPQ